MHLLVGTTYDNDITGLARDDDANLNQRQSKSENESFSVESSGTADNTKTIVAMALSDFAGLNKDNTGSFSSDLIMPI